MSPSRFCHEFKAIFAVTFVEYLAQYRMERAKRLLANPTISVADVAVSVGFNDPSYFTRVFRKQEGLSPSEYRANKIFEVNSRPHPAPSPSAPWPGGERHMLSADQRGADDTATETSPFGGRLSRLPATCS
jgi:hypothetical protein